MLWSLCKVHLWTPKLSASLATRPREDASWLSGTPTWKKVHPSTREEKDTGTPQMQDPAQSRKQMFLDCVSLVKKAAFWVSKEKKARLLQSLWWMPHHPPRSPQLTAMSTSKLQDHAKSTGESDNFKMWKFVLFSDVSFQLGKFNLSPECVRTSGSGRLSHSQSYAMDLSRCFDIQAFCFGSSLQSTWVFRISEEIANMDIMSECVGDSEKGRRIDRINSLERSRWKFPFLVWPCFYIVN